MLFSQEQLAVLGYVRSHPGCTAYEVEADLGSEMLPVLQVLAEELEVVSIGLEYEDWMGCAIALEPAGEDALADAARAQGHPMRRKDRQLEREQALEILDGCQWALLSTADGDGTPYGVPLNLVRDRERIYFHCALEGHKVDNLRANPAVCVTAVGHCEVIPEQLTTHYRCAIVHGTAREVTDPGEKRSALVLLCRRFAPEHQIRSQEEIANLLERTGVWCISIDRITGKGNVPKD